MDAKKIIISLLEYLEKNNLDIDTLLAVEFSENICKTSSPFVKTYTQSDKRLLLEDFKDGFICEYILFIDSFLVDNTFFLGLYEIIYDENTDSYSYDIRLTVEETNKIIDEFYIDEDEEQTEETVEEETEKTEEKKETVQITKNVSDKKTTISEEKLTTLQKAIDIAKQITNIEEWNEIVKIINNLF